MDATAHGAQHVAETTTGRSGAAIIAGVPRMGKVDALVAWRAMRQKTPPRPNTHAPHLPTRYDHSLSAPRRRRCND